MLAPIVLIRHWYLHAVGDCLAPAQSLIARGLNKGDPHRIDEALHKVEQVSWMLARDRLVSQVSIMGADDGCTSAMRGGCASLAWLGTVRHAGPA